MAAPRKLRVLRIDVQPVLVWDDGETLTPGPTVEPSSWTVNDLPTMPDRLREAVAELQARDAAEPRP